MQQSLLCEANSRSASHEEH